MLKLKPIALCVCCAVSMAGCALPHRQPAERPTAPAASTARPAPVSAEGMVRLARYYEGQKRNSQAIAAYREALRRDPLMIEAYTGLGMVLAAEGRYGDAIREFQAAVVLAPDVAHTHNNLGYAYLLRGSHEHAIKSLEEAQRLDPASETSRHNLRVAHTKSGGQSSEMTLVEVAPHVFELKANRSQAPIERSFRLEVANGNGVGGLAQRVADRLAGQGMRAVRLTNQRPFEQARTEVHYRDGYAAEAARLAGKLQDAVTLVPSEQLAGRIDVRLVLGRDALRESALFAPVPVHRIIARAPDGA
jgi:tetratricopeptide (TPR) repeat protein